MVNETQWRSRLQRTQIYVPNGIYFVSCLHVCPYSRLQFLDFKSLNNQSWPVWCFFCKDSFILKIYLMSSEVVMICYAFVFRCWLSNFFLCLFLHQFSCSLHLFLRGTDVCPMYFIGHSLHGIEYTVFHLYCCSTFLPFFERMSPSVCVFLHTTANPKSSFNILNSLLARGW